MALLRIRYCLRRSIFKVFLDNLKKLEKCLFVFSSDSPTIYKFLIVSSLERRDDFRTFHWNNLKIPVTFSKKFIPPFNKQIEELMTYWKFFLISLFMPFLLFSEIVSNPPEEMPTVLLAILARNKAHTLPTYLNCIDNLDYDKKKIFLYIHTYNNTDKTEEILKSWMKEHQKDYASIEFEIDNINDVDSNRPQRNVTRFKTLALIRNKSMEKAIEKQTDFYFVVDCNNFIAPNTLSYLVSKNKPIMAPLLKAIPEPWDIYSNYFCAVSSSGYYESHPDYMKIWSQTEKGNI